MTKTNKLPAHLAGYHEMRIERAKMVSELIYDLLKESTQPLTALEVRKMVQQYTGHLYDTSYIRNILNAHIESGRVSTRMETEAERFMRAGNRSPRGIAGRYFWAPAGEVPARTEMMVVDGLILDSDNTYSSSKRRPKKRAKTSGPARKITVQTDSISELIDVIVAERMKPMQARIDELEKVLTGIKSALS